MERSLVRLLWMLLLASTAAAAQAEPRIYLLASGTPSNPALSNVIERAAQLQLRGAGLTGVVGGRLPSVTGGPPEGATAAAQPQSSFVLSVRFRTESGKVLMDLSFADAAGGKLLDESSVAFPLDLNLDVRVGAAVKQVLASAAVRAALAAARRAADQTRAASSPHGSASPAGGPSVQAEGGVAGKAVPARPQESGVATLAPGAASTATPAKPRWGFTASGQAAPLVLVGGASSYFRYGADLSLFAGTRLPTRGLVLQVGVKLGATELFPVSGLLPGQAYLLLAGPEVRIENGVSSPVGVAARASAGAAVILLRMAGASTQAKTVPYVDAGLSTSLRLIGTVRLGVALGYLAAFESEFPIMGFAPALEVGNSW